MRTVLFALAITIAITVIWRVARAWFLSRSDYTNPREGRLISGFSDRSESDSLEANRRFAMRPGIALRPAHHAAQLWALAKATRDAGQSRRLRALCEIYDGGSRTKAGRIGGVGLLSVRACAVRFNGTVPD